MNKGCRDARFIKFKKWSRRESKGYPTLIWGVPAGLESWYASPPRAEFIDDGSRWFKDKICPMRGSIVGITSQNPLWRDGGYQIVMARKYGKRFANWCERTGKSFIVLKGKPCFLDTDDNWILGRSFSSFENGFSRTNYGRGRPVSFFKDDNRHLVAIFIGDFTIFADRFKMTSDQKISFNSLIGAMFDPKTTYQFIHELNAV